MYSRPLVCVRCSKDTKPSTSLDPTCTKDDVGRFISLLVKYASGLRYNVNVDDVGVSNASFCIEYTIGEYLGKKLLIDVESRGRGDSGKLGKMRLIDLMVYSRSSPLSPIGEFEIVNVVSRIVEELAGATSVTWAHTVLKKNYQVVLRDNVDPILGYVDADPLSSSMLTVALLSGVHRLGLALRQVAAQHTLYNYLLGHSYCVDNAAKIIASLVFDTLVYFTVTVQLFKRGALGTELVYNVSATPIRVEVKLPPEELFPKIRTYLDEKVRQHYVKLRNILNKLAIDSSISEIARMLSSNLMQPLLEVENEITCATLGVAVGYRTEPLIGRGIILTNTILRLLDSQDTTGFKPKTLIISLTEQTSPAYIEFLKKLVEEKLDTRINKTIILFTQLTLYNAQAILDYTRQYKESIGEIKLIPVTSTDPLYNKAIAEKIARKEEDIIAILQGSATTTFSLASGLSKAKNKKIIIA